MNEKQRDVIQSKLDNGETLDEIEVDMLHADKDENIDEDAYGLWMQERGGV